MGLGFSVACMGVFLVGDPCMGCMDDVEGGDEGVWSMGLRSALGRFSCT